MINGLGKARPGHACSLMSFLFRQSQLNQFLTPICHCYCVGKGTEDWTVDTDWTDDDGCQCSGNVDSRQVQVMLNDRAGDHQTGFLAGWNAWNGEVLLEFQNKHCQVDTQQ